MWGAPQERIKQNDDKSITTFPICIRKATHTRNDHNHADELSVTTDVRDAGIDPRLLSNAIVTFWMGNANDDSSWEPSDADRRFVGIVTGIERSLGGGQSSVEISALDYTSLLIDSKPYPPQGVPTYTMDLKEAWEMICDHAGGRDVEGNWFRSVEFLRDKLEPLGVEPWPPKLSAVLSRRLEKASVKSNHTTDAWAVWQRCVGMLGLVSWIDRDKVIVATATNLYSGEDPAVLRWGKNITSIREKRNCAIAGKKIALKSYNPLDGSVLTAFYPAPKAPTAKRTKTGKPGKSSGQQEHFDVFEANGITDQTALDTLCRRVYEERSRQELEGTLVTSELWVDRVSGDTASLLDLRSGEDVRVELDRDTLDGMLDLQSEQERVSYLVDRGLSDGIATVLARGVQDRDRLTATFHTKSVRTSIEVDQSGGSVDIEVSYCNRIEVSGDASA